MSDFASKYNLGEEGEKELLILFNKGLLEISSSILTTTSTSKVNLKKVDGIKRYKSKKAEEYALENDIEIDEFEMLEISKKDVEEKIRNKTSNNIGNNTKEKGKDKSKEISKCRVICSGISKRGEACKSTGTILPEGAKKRYCFRHAEDYKSFECDSDSSDEEDNKEVPNEKEEINDDDKELTEEEIEN